MVRKTLLAAWLMLICYEVIIRVFIPGHWQFIQHPEQANQVKAQTFLYGTRHSPDYVLVGTSLSAKLELPNVYNLAFAGQSIYDGLRLLRQVQGVPKYLLIETNVVLKPANSSFSGALLSEPLFSLRRYVKLLRDDVRPMAAAGYLLQKAGIPQVFIGPASSALRVWQHGQGKETSTAQQPAAITPAGLVETLVADKVAAYAHAPSPDSLKQFLHELQGYTRYFVARGTTIIFYEVPAHPAVAASPYMRAVQQSLQQSFRSTGCKWIPGPQSLVVRTSDGVHLTDAEMQAYTPYLLQSLSSIVKQ